MKTYKWNNNQLKKQNQWYFIGIALAMLVTLISINLLPANSPISYVAIVGLMLLAVGFVWKALRIQAEDKKLKNRPVTPKHKTRG